jgi:hypothetical protein
MDHLRGLCEKIRFHNCEGVCWLGLVEVAGFLRFSRLFLRCEIFCRIDTHLPISSRLTSHHNLKMNLCAHSNALVSFLST